MFRHVKAKEQIRDERQNRLANTVRQINDADNVAEMVVLNLMDKEELASMVGYCLMRIDELEVKING